MNKKTVERLKEIRSKHILNDPEVQLGANKKSPSPRG